MNHQPNAARVNLSQAAMRGLRDALPELPFGDDGPVFREPWEAQAFAMTLALYERGVFTWHEWARTLSDSIRDAQATGDPDRGDTYYAHWLDALERISAKKGCVSAASLARRRDEWHAAARRTPHGQPIELRRALAAVTLHAYTVAIYRIDKEPCIDMRIDRVSEAAALLMRQHDAKSAVFVTAFNPFGRKLDAADNEARQRALTRYVARLGLHALPGAGRDPAQRWEAEESLFVLGATRDTADMLMRAFEQNAVVHVDETGFPRLVLHPAYR